MRLPSVQGSLLDQINALYERIQNGALEEIYRSRRAHKKSFKSFSALRGAERLFGAQRPLLMIEGANRNPEVVELMHRHGYFHAVRAEGYLVPHPEPSDMNDGFWVHPDKSDGYRAAGILRGADPPRA